MIIDCISDLHSFYPELEGGDLLIVAGDLTSKDDPKEYMKFYDWIAKTKYRKRIVIAGNHDYWCEKTPDIMLIMRDFEYLCDSGTEFEGLKIWGSPWCKTFEGMNPNCKAFTFDTEEKLDEKWKLIPHDVDILITHSPPYRIFDEVQNHMTGKMEYFGSKSLSKQIFLKDRFPNLTLHCFGHIHEHGSKISTYFKPTLNTMTFLNASLVNERYEPVNKPVRVIL